MPWTVADVDRFKAGLTPEQQRRWVAIANRALAACEAAGETDCDAKAIRQANGAVSASEAMTFAARPLLFATAQEWIAFLPRPGTYAHPDYGEIELTPAKLAAMLANFKANTYGQHLPINAEHDFSASGAVGWITDMRLADDGSLEVKPEWNERGRALIDGDRFRYVSAEFYDEWQDPVSGETHRDVANGLAICTRPHFKTDVLRPLAASEAEAVAMTEREPIRFNAEDEPKTQPATPEPEPTTPDVPAEQPTPKEEPAPMADDPNEELQPTETPPETVNLNEQTVYEFGEMRKRLAASEKTLAETQAALAGERREKRLKTFTDEIRGRSDQNDTPWIGDIESHVQFCMDLAEKFGEDSAQLKHYVTTNRAHAQQVKQSNLFREIGTSRSKETISAYDRVHMQATERAKASGKTVEQEFDAVLSADAALRSELARERRQERG